MGGSGYFGSMPGQVGRGAVNRFRIPTCDQHAISFEETARLRTPCTICNGLLIIITIFLGVSTLGSLMVAGLNFTSLILLTIAIIGLAITWIASGPTELERTVKVLDSSEGFGMLILQIRNEEYAQEVLRLNPMSAKLLKATRAY